VCRGVSDEFLENGAGWGTYLKCDFAGGSG
jgi:hypothetical protein